MTATDIATPTARKFLSLYQRLGHICKWTLLSRSQSVVDADIFTKSLLDSYFLYDRIMVEYLDEIIEIVELAGSIFP